MPYHLVPGRAIRALAAALLCCFLGSSGALADETGANAGRHHRRDTAAKPGVTCRYGGRRQLIEMDVRPPVIFAKDRGAGTDHEWVGWAPYFETSTKLGDVVTWYPVGYGEFHAARATDSTAATFRKGIHRLIPHAFYYRWRVTIRMFWMYPTRTDLDAMVSALVTHYQDGAHVRSGCPDFRP